ncbi:MAG: hypothetical protein V4724_02725 [Pseudomonadota bacterium]
MSAYESPEQASIGERLQAAIARRVAARAMFETAVDSHDRKTAKIARRALDVAAAEAAMLYKNKMEIVARF